MDNIERIKIYDETKRISKIKLQNISESVKYKRLNIKLKGFDYDRKFVFSEEAVP